MKHASIPILLLLACYSHSAENITSDSAAQPATVTMSPIDSICYFAEYLYSSGYYARALYEYQRAFRRTPPSPEKRHILNRIGHCHRSLHDFDSVAAVFLHLSDGAENDSLFLQYSIERIMALLDAGRIVKAREEAQELLQRTSEPAAAAFVVYIHLKERNPDKADLTLQRFLNCPEKENPVIDLSRSWVQSYQKAVYKREAIAGLIAAFVPGGGKIYAGQVRDGFMAMEVMAFSAVQGIDGFYRKGLRSIKGWLFSTIAASFYFANIYGSVLEVRSYNNRIHSGKLDEIEVSLRVQILGR